MNDLIKYLFIALAVSLISVTSSAGTKSVFITTDKAEIKSAVDAAVSSKQKKQIYHGKINSSVDTNQYVYRAQKSTQNEIVFTQTQAQLAIFQLIGDELETMTSSGAKDAQISKITFLRKDDKNIKVDIERISMDGGKENRLNYQVDAIFTQGNWADLLENKNVTIAVSRQEEVKSKKYIQEWLQRTVFFKAVEKAGRLIKQVTPKTALEFKAPIIKGNLNRMVHTVDKTKIQFEVKWGLM